MNGTPSEDRLYQLLPAVYRVRDSAAGEPLRALLSLIQAQYDAIEQDIAGLYENWFIETCDEWVVPYIGDLLAVRPLHAASPDTFSARAYVANTLDFRRRKGTAAMLEALALDVTGWPAHVVEFFQNIATTQYLNHRRPANLATASVRDSGQLELLGGPFEQTAHTVDVRRISGRGGKYNIPSIGIFLWRLENYAIGPIPIAAADPTRPDSRGASRQSDARAVAAPPDGRYTFDPLGISAPLFNLPQTRADDGMTLAAEVNLPGPLRLRPLYHELEALRQAKVDGALAPPSVYLGTNPVFQLVVNGTVVPFLEVMACDISDVSTTDWRRPLASLSYTPSGGGAAVTMPIALSIDPVRGRIAFPAGVSPASVEVAYTYGFSGDIGAGPYDRSAWLLDSRSGLAPFLHSPNLWQAGVSQEIPADGIKVFGTLGAAVKVWNTLAPGTIGVIAVLDSRTYREDLSGANGIVVPAGSQLLIVAADWPAVRPTGAAQTSALVLDGVRPHVLGPISAAGSAPAASTNAGSLFIDGLLVEGAITVENGNLGTLSVSHSTITPGGGLTILSSGAAGGDNDRLTVNLYRSICGPIAMNVSAPTLNTVDSLITSGAASASLAAAITAPGATAHIATTTVFGTANVLIIEASDSLFTGVVTATRRQTGCVRFCYVPAGSQTGRRYECQPDLALALALAAPAPAARSNTLARLTPQFTSTDFGQPGYAQLSSRCASEITAGSDDGSEMGVFHYLQQPQRMANLMTALEEYLRFGLEAGTIEET